MEQRIALIVVRARTVWVDRRADFVHVAGVEELVVCIAEFAAVGEVAADVVKGPDARGEGDMGGVGEGGGTEDEDAVLVGRFSVTDMSLKVRGGVLEPLPT